MSIITTTTTTRIVKEMSLLAAGVLVVGSLVYAGRWTYKRFQTAATTAAAPTDNDADIADTDRDTDAEE